MAMERVTVEQNGERFTLEVPEGTTDDQIKNFIAQQQSAPNPLTTMEPSLADPVQGMAAGAAIKGAFGSPETRVTSPVGPVKPTLANPGVIPRVAGEVVDLASDLSRVTPKGLAYNMAHPIQTIAGLPEAFATRYLGAGNMDRSFRDMAKSAGQAVMNPANLRNVATGIGAMAMAPENLFAAPYQMAAYEQEKIRANPTAPEYATNPYAQMYRGEYATQGQAGAANRRNAIRNMPYGNVTAEERAMLDADREIGYAMRLKAAKKVLGQP